MKCNFVRECDGITLRGSGLACRIVEFVSTIESGTACKGLAPDTRVEESSDLAGQTSSSPYDLHMNDQSASGQLGIVCQYLIGGQTCQVSLYKGTDSEIRVS